MKLFNKKVKGLIHFFELEDFWLNRLSDSERKFLKDNYGKGSIGEIPDSLTKGEIALEATRLYFLTGLLSMIGNSEYFELGLKIIEEAEQNISSTKDKLDIHFYLNTKIDFFYKNREHGDNLEKAIVACKEQIEFAEIARKEFLKEFKEEELPSHRGYKQLVIIYEKQKKFKEAISLCEKAMEQGWNEDWEHRIEKLTKKLK